MTKNNKKKRTSDEVLEAAQAKVTIPDNVIAMFKDVAEVLNKKSDEESAVGVNGNPLIVDENVVQGELVLTMAEEVAAETPSVPAGEPAVEIATNVAETTETPSAPIQAPSMVGTPKPPRKPWLKPLMASLAVKFADAYRVVTNAIGIGIGHVFTFFVVLGTWCLLLIPGIIYAAGFTASFIQHSWLNGYNRRPMMDPSETVGTRVPKMVAV